MIPQNKTKNGFQHSMNSLVHRDSVEITHANTHKLATEMDVNALLLMRNAIWSPHILNVVIVVVVPVSLTISCQIGTFGTDKNNYNDRIYALI